MLQIIQLFIIIIISYTYNKNRYKSIGCKGGVKGGCGKPNFKSQETWGYIFK
jgi:hypothetical protein